MLSRALHRLGVFVWCSDKFVTNLSYECMRMTKDYVIIHLFLVVGNYYKVLGTIIGVKRHRNKFYYYSTHVL